MKPPSLLDAMPGGASLNQEQRISKILNRPREAVEIERDWFEVHPVSPKA